MVAAALHGPAPNERCVQHLPPPTHRPLADEVVLSPHRQRRWHSPRSLFGRRGLVPRDRAGAPPDRSGLLIGANERLGHYREATLVSDPEEIPELLFRRVGVAGLELPEKPRIVFLDLAHACRGGRQDEGEALRLGSSSSSSSESLLRVCRGVQRRVVWFVALSATQLIVEDNRAVGHDVSQGVQVVGRHGRSAVEGHDGGRLCRRQVHRSAMRWRGEIEGETMRRRSLPLGSNAPRTPPTSICGSIDDTAPQGELVQCLPFPRHLAVMAFILWGHLQRCNIHLSGVTLVSRHH
ncbi:hypothetical protein THAOC_04328 [Thalassiosira oceanica]|uniref:Uncharacterized protein n=1 Tax=Thalassiosira oceanica TaxID=159749 RepID=K0T900_THAOC|nr:hypothetical protein THAOC_04328 [Thalassiosira oceanica]|eukprot:EJK74020.1 hypothetical protein THAOC_04328 [Thalassiosira oceanica]